MSMIGRIHKWLTHRYSKPIILMSRDDAIQWVANNPRCSICNRAIDSRHDNYTVCNDSVQGVSACHYDCVPTR